MDISNFLYESIDKWCLNKFDDPNEMRQMCGFYQAERIEKWNDYYFSKGEDFFESAFIASKKNNPIIDKWHLVLKTFWNNRRSLDHDILNHELFKQLPRRFDIAYYVTIHVAFRKLIGQDPLSRNIYLNHTLSQDVWEHNYLILKSESWDGPAISNMLF